MKAAAHPAVSVNFHGKEVMVIAKRLSKVELDSCGEFSLINLNTDNTTMVKDQNLVEMAKFAELQHNVLKLSLVNPTYQQIEDRLVDQAGVKNLKSRMRDMVEKFNLIEDPKIKKQMESEYAILEFRVKFFLPQDFLIDMFTFATSQDISDIKLITSEEILHNAAIMAKKGNCRVSDILCEDGVFTPHNKSDIDMRAEIILFERSKKK